MTLKIPNLDDRTFDDLLSEAKAIIDQRCPQWSDRSPSDPGMTLIEVFVHLTEVLIYRVNQFPAKAHLALLDLLSVAPLAPAAAEVTLTFTRTSQGDGRLPAIRIPAGTLASDRTGSTVFATLVDAELTALPPGAGTDPPQSVDVPAINAEQVEGEPVGRGTGEPGQFYTVRRGPILRRLTDAHALVVGVEVTDADQPDNGDFRSLEGKTFALWREVSAFVGCGPSDRVYFADRARGTIVFGPANIGGTSPRSMGAAPAKGREIRVWYRRGGGRLGNLSAGAITMLKSPINGVAVENRARAFGGEDMEPLERAIARGRGAVRVLRSAVTARDFEDVACETAGIARARAYAQRDVWAFGRPGTVDVLVVPDFDLASLPDGITTEVLAAHQTAELLANARELVRARRPVGVEARLAWTRCRPVDISARIVVQELEEREAVKARLTRRLHALLAPDGAWQFGRALRASDVYEVLLAERGLRYVDRLSFHIADAPSEAIADLTRDHAQPQTLHAAGRSVFRSLDAGESWASILERPNETFLGVRTNPALPGWLAAFSRQEAGPSHVVYVSLDGGESFDDPRRAAAIDPEERMARFAFNFEIRDLAWNTHDGVPVLLVAGRAALQKIRFSVPVIVEILPVRGTGASESAEDQRGFEAVAVARHVSGLEFTAVAARERLGVYLSAGGGPFALLPDTAGKNIRVLAFQHQGNDTFLWAGISAEKGEEGQGAQRIGVRIDGGYDPTSWTAFKENWSGGSCETLDFHDDLVAAGTNRSGILLWRIGADKKWSNPPTIGCGLPPVDERRSLPPARGAVMCPTDNGMSLFFGGDEGIYRSDDLGMNYVANGCNEFEDRVPLPRNWLFCSGSIELDVFSENGEEG
ncbi:MULTISPECIES: baseplate J/gp47 family protein [unclassified Ensifer]|uniref:baseplate J/gp47 family protein n=1 Tax=unclassified Ensifer TaxID=2633371 RepID=UPI00300FC674